MERAVLGAGCFWGVERVYRMIRGVERAICGYMGGESADPDYKAVKTGATGHAEVIELLYDPNSVSYRQLLEIFWECHDPTTLNRQGPDVGSQYRSAIFYTTEEQKAEALTQKRALGNSGQYSRPIVTEIVPASRFYRAEEYHQNYFHKNPGQIVGMACHPLPTKYLKEVGGEKAPG